MSIEREKIQLGEKEIIIETGKYAKLADGSVTMQLGETIVLITAVSQTKIRDGQDWFPLSVEYKEKAAAAGLFPGGYFKREGRPTEKEILTCRMTDRPLRPLFPKGYYYDTQIIAILLSADGENDPDVLSINGASAALCISDIPFDGPIGAIRIGMIDGDFVANPTNEQRKESILDLIYVGKKDQVIMIEGSAKELNEEDFKKALAFANEQIKPIIKAQENLIEKVGKPTREFIQKLTKDELLDIAVNIAGSRIEDAIYKPSKVERHKAVEILRDEVNASILEEFPEATGFEINQAFDYIQKNAFRKSILENGKRADGRKVNELRELYAEASPIPRTHGSAIFSRGETQALALATLAPLKEAQFVDNYTGSEKTKRFILHYNFPPFSVGETGRMGGFNRREIGHGALAERSIEPLIPSEEEFPYSIRVTSEVMESNGSTSMASVCSGSMALMDAGVKLKSHVAGISVGLVTETDDSNNIQRKEFLLDIIGSEDFFGDMDFKLCGTNEGVTGCQLDLKLPGIPLDILNQAIDQAKDARLTILDVMNDAISDSKSLSPHAPQIVSIKIDKEKIGAVIGTGGKTIRGIQEETGAEISIEDDGTIRIYAINKDKLDAARIKIEQLTEEVEVGNIYHAKVVSTTTFGAFIEVLPGTDGLIHISELADFPVGCSEDIVNIGDIIYAKCIGIDDKGRIKMSRKEAMADRGETDTEELKKTATENFRNRQNNPRPSNSSRNGRSDRSSRPPRAGARR